MGIENNEVVSSNGMSSLVYWEIWNFMSFDHAKFEFDDENIINLLGYNNSGKSSALRALEVNMYNRFPQSQLSFIKSGKDYFRVVSVWSDGIVILRDKYANGQSLYEMWRGDECLFSTKQNGVLTKVSDVPICIQEYLNLVKFDDSCLNSRSCFEKQFLVQTSGGENYAALNTVSKSEELSLAGALVNTDRNKLASDITTAETEYNVLMKQYKEGIELTDDLVDSLKSHDKLLDVSEEKLSSIASMKETSEKLAQIPVVQELSSISWDSLQLLDVVKSCNESISSLGEIPQMGIVDNSRLDLLLTVSDSDVKLKSIPTYSKLISMNDEQLADLVGILNLGGKLIDVDSELVSLSERLEKLSAESKSLSEHLSEFGVRTIRCKNCGALVEVGGESNAEQCGCM